MRVKLLVAVAAMSAMAMTITACEGGGISANAGSLAKDSDLVVTDRPLSIGNQSRIEDAKQRITQVVIADSSDGGVKYKRSSMYPTWEPAWPEWGWDDALPKKKDGTPACDVREATLIRDAGATYNPKSCSVAKELNYVDPYTGAQVTKKGDIDIDHLVALSDAHRSGAWNISEDWRISLANDPENLMAVLDTENRAKGDKNAAEYLPPNPGIRCSYVAGQTNIKFRYGLTMTPTEHAAITSVLASC